MNYGCSICIEVAADPDAGADALVVRPPGTSPADAVVVAPRRHVRALSRLDDDEYAAVWALVDTIRARWGDAWALSGTVSVRNVPQSGALTTDHAHVVVVPRHHK